VRVPAVLLGFIVVLGVGGYLLTSTTIRRDRDEAAARRARVEAVQAQEVLGRARAYVDGLATLLSGEPEPGQARFARWANATSASVGLNDVLWVEPVARGERARYERRRGVPITRMTASGRLVRAREARLYLPASFTSEARAPLRPGVDVAGIPALAAAISDRARIFAVGASRPATLAGEPGFYLLEAATFAGGRNRGYLVAFVPQGWFSTTLGGDPRRVAISEDGQRIEGRLDSVQATAHFEMLGRDWRIDVSREPPSGLQSLLPWMALAWPFAVAGVALAIARAVVLRRRAQRDVERIFELSLDLVCVIGLDGRFKNINPAFEEMLGYSRQELVSRPFIRLVHPDDRERSREAFAGLLGGDEIRQFENRYICADGSERWLQWNARGVPEEGVVYATARDVTERRRVDAELREAQRTAEARGAELHVRAAEQTALRRVATLVAREAPQEEVFDAMAEEISQLLGTDQIRMMRDEGDGTAVVVGSVGNLDVFPLGLRLPLEGDSPVSVVLSTGRPARVNDLATASGPLAERIRSIGIRSAVGAPIVVTGRQWGAIVTGSTRDESLPPGTEARLSQFTELMATAIANTEARRRADRLADEQAALRRVATLVAKEPSPAEVFGKVAEEAARTLGDAECSLWRYEGDGTLTAVAAWGVAVAAVTPPGTRLAVDETSVVASLMRDERPVRDDDISRGEGTIAAHAREQDLHSTVACPIVVGGRTWGMMSVTCRDPRPLPADTEARLAQFSDLVATAIANADARAEVERLAEEQAALRRVATLVAQGAPAATVFDAVAAEVERLLGADGVTLSRYEEDDEVTVVAHRGSDPRRVPIGTRLSHRGENVMTMVRRSEHLARMEHSDGSTGAIAEVARGLGVRASVGAPIVVEGRLWGVAIATWRGAQSPPADTAERMAKFAQLLDAAIANADSRDQLTASRARLLTAADAARRRLARDLHDGAQQRLVHAIVTLKLAQRALQEDSDEAAALVAEALQHAQQGQVELRELAHGILPASLTGGGLAKAVEAVASRVDLPVDLDVTPERFPAAIEASAYFIVAEALTNVLKHAQATRAEVRAFVQDGALQVEVRDDGIGGADPEGSGLVGIADRATALGGRLDVETPLGGGTLLIATLPIRSA
jgi:PAS domain S-box-containing protein